MPFWWEILYFLQANGDVCSIFASRLAGRHSAPIKARPDQQAQHTHLITTSKHLHPMPAQGPPQVIIELFQMFRAHLDHRPVMLPVPFQPTEVLPQFAW